MTRGGLGVWAGTDRCRCRQVGHMRLVIGRIEVYTIPTGREKDLSPEAIWAAGFGECWSLGSRRTRVVEANSCLVFSKRCGKMERKPTSSRRLPWIQGCRCHVVQNGFPVNMQGRLGMRVRSHLGRIAGDSNCTTD